MMWPGHNLIALCKTGLPGPWHRYEPARAADSQAQVPDGTLVHRYVSKLPLASKTFDAMLAFDALEHVDNAKAFAEAFRVLKPEGLAMSTVLAYALLLSYRYRAAGHLRRQSSGPNDSPLAPKQLLA